jgi:hypothetical protein
MPISAGQEGGRGGEAPFAVWHYWKNGGRSDGRLLAVQEVIDQPATQVRAESVLERDLEMAPTPGLDELLCLDGQPVGLRTGGRAAVATKG